MPDARTILVVEDFEPFRAFACTTLQKRAGFQVFQAADGLEAVQKAQELQPDLILIDIGLPKLNDIEAAKRIRTLAPNAHLLFLSQESDSDIVHETFRLGASAYIHKPFALSHLLPAIDVALCGGRFLSSQLDFKPADPRLIVKNRIAPAVRGVVSFQGELSLRQFLQPPAAFEFCKPPVYDVGEIGKVGEEQLVPVPAD